MRTRPVGLAVVLASISLSPLAARGETLTIGDPAPPLSVAKWVKGEKLDKLDPGQVYVVEFWATWCGPCRASIPHLTELQKKHKDVNFIGVSIWENEQEKVEPFVKEMGEKMDYRVAMDDVPKDSERGRDGKMALAWMKAAEEDGIPTAFVVGKDGKIAWIGHPMEIDKPLDKIVSGDWDVKAAQSKRAEELAPRVGRSELFGKISPLWREPAKNAKEILAAFDGAFAKNPLLEKQLGPMRFGILLYGSDRQAASDYGTRLVDSTCKDDANSLNSVSWAIVNPTAKFDDSHRDVKLALRAAERANELTKGENAMILDTLALAVFLNGDPVRALELQEKAVKLQPNLAKNPGVSERLEKYRKAAGKAKDKDGDKK